MMVMIVVVVMMMMVIVIMVVMNHSFVAKADILELDETFIELELFCLG